MRFVGWFGVIVGLMMLAQWTFFLAAGQVPEIQSEPFRIVFHLMAEALTALALIVSGAGLLRGRAWARHLALLALGMLIYTVIQSPGYFAQQGVWALVAMFAVLLVLALVSVRRVVQEW
jgi:hypothetical protein